MKCDGNRHGTKRRTDHSDDVKHGLRQVTALELVKDGQKKGIDVSLHMRERERRAEESITTLSDTSK